jgi:predicted XRE-type DNA-binding protein
MTSKRFANVWDAIEDTPEQAENMKLRSTLLIALKAHLTRSGLSQAQIAKRFGVTQPRVSDLMRGMINLNRPGFPGDGNEVWVRPVDR